MSYERVELSEPSPSPHSPPLTAAVTAAAPVTLDVSSAGSVQRLFTAAFTSFLPGSSAQTADTAAASNPTPVNPMSSPPPSASGSSMLGIDSSELNGFVTRIRGRRWIQTFRPINSFFGQTQFTKPRTTAEAMARLENNLPYFLTNYLAICSLVVVITILSQPSLILVGLFLAAMWAASMRVVEVRLPGQLVLAGRNKMLALSSISGVVLFIFAGTTIFFLVGICATIVLAHAVLHTLPPLEDGNSDEMSEFIGSDERSFEAGGTQV